jgi:hypothetical protein
MVTQLHPTALPGPARTWTTKETIYVPAIGGNDANCMLLLHADDVEGSVQFIDSSFAGSTKTFDPKLTTRQTGADKKFGVSSMIADGGGSYLEIAANSDFAFEDGDFTIDFWGKCRDPNRPYFLGWYEDDDNYFGIERVWSQGNKALLKVVYRVAGVTIAETAWVDQKQVVTDWTHYAIVRTSTSLNFYINGTLNSTASLTDSVNLHTWPLCIGAGMLAGQSDLRAMDGYIDEVRILAGVAAFTEDFSVYGNPYTARFTVDSLGEHHVYDSFSVDAVGEHGVIYHPFSVDASGEHIVYARTLLDATGEHHLRASTSLDATGEFGLAFRRFAVDALGEHRVRARTSMDAVGEHSLAAGRFTVDAVGEHTIRAGFTVDATGEHNALGRYTVDAAGEHSVENTTLERYELYHNLGSAPDITGAPDETFSSLPHTTSATFTGAGLHYFALFQRNRYNQRSAQVPDYASLVELSSWIIELDGADEVVVLPPDGPETVDVQPTFAGAVLVTAAYNYDINDWMQADEWLVYIRNNGTDPVPGVDSPTVITMQKSDGVANLEWTSPTYSDTDDVRVIVRTRRLVMPLSPQMDSENVDVHGTTASTQPPAAPEVEIVE